MHANYRKSIKCFNLCKPCVLFFSLDNCPPGQYYVANTSGCVPCERHYYQHMTGQDFCYPCPHGTITSEKGSNSSDSCYRKNAEEGKL